MQTLSSLYNKNGSKKNWFCFGTLLDLNLMAVKFEYDDSDLNWLKLAGSKQNKLDKLEFFLDISTSLVLIHIFREGCTLFNFLMGCWLTEGENFLDVAYESKHDQQISTNYFRSGKYKSIVINAM